MNVPGTHDRQVASYLIGTPNPSSITNPGFMAVCFNCAKSIVGKLPDELLVHVNVEKTLALMDEEKRDAIFDKFFDDADPKDALESLLDTMDKEAVRSILLDRGYLADEGQPENTEAEKPEDTKEPVVYSSPNRDAPITGDNGLLKCPHCDFTTMNPNALRGHIGGKHKGGKQA